MEQLSQARSDLRQITDRNHRSEAELSNAELIEMPDAADHDVAFSRIRELFRRPNRRVVGQTI